MWKMKYWILVYTTQVDNTFHIHRLAREEVKSKYKWAVMSLTSIFLGGLTFKLLSVSFPIQILRNSVS